MSRPPPSQTTPQFYRVSDRDLTEVELHSVESINDLHRTQLEHSHKGSRPPPPPPPPPPPRPAYTPSLNGNLSAGTGQNPVGQNRLQQLLTSPRGFVGCAVIALLLLSVLLISCLLVQQRRTMQTLSLLLQEVEAQRHNVTTGKGGT